MTKIIFVDHTGNEHTVEAENGHTLMETAVSNGVPGIDADCGGACACATCHVFVKADWREQVGDRSEMESSMLEFAENVRPESRLSCQIQIGPELDGLTVELPEAQH